MELQLEELGLSKGEVKVYLALFDLKEGTKYSIAKVADVSASKVYEILDKLIKKGLVTSVIKNNVKHFHPANPHKLEEYVKLKKEEVKKEESIVNNLIPLLTSKLAHSEEQTKVEVFEGVNGMRSILSTIEKEFDSKHEWAAMGIRSGKKETFNNIVEVFHRNRASKGVVAKMLFTDKNTDFYKSLQKLKHTQIKVLEQFTPAGITTYKNKTAIFYYGDKPSFILITNEGIAQSFREFFNGLWKIAKK